MNEGENYEVNHVKKKIVKKEKNHSTIHSRRAAMEHCHSIYVCVVSDNWR